MTSNDTLLTGRTETASLPTIDDCITAVEKASKLLAQGESLFPCIMGVPPKGALDPLLVSSNKIIVDSVDQCERIGEQHHAISNGLLNRNDVQAEFGEVAAGKRQAGKRILK